MDTLEALRILRRFNYVATDMFNEVTIARKMLHGGENTYEFSIGEQGDVTYSGGIGDTEQTRALANDLRLFYQQGDIVSFQNVRAVYESCLVDGELARELGALLAAMDKSLDSPLWIAPVGETWTYRRLLETTLYGRVSHVEYKGDSTRAEDYDRTVGAPLFGFAFMRPQFDTAVHAVLRAVKRIRDLNERAIAELLESANTGTFNAGSSDVTNG